MVLLKNTILVRMAKKSEKIRDLILPATLKKEIL
jgi:hypothetical protein